jgi:hypothetical protein
MSHSEDFTTNAQVHRVERIMAELTKPTFVWRMAGSKLYERGRLGLGARTTYYRVIKELDKLLLETLRREYNEETLQSLGEGNLPD